MTEPAATPPVNVTALFAEGASKSALVWVDVPGDRAWPVWHAWADDTVYVVSGPGEQELPWLPAEVGIVLRSKDSGGRLLRVRATVREVAPDGEGWQAATTALAAARLNATDDLLTRWAQECTVRALQPFGEPLESPGRYSRSSHSSPPPATPATTARWKPWHFRGRPRRRRGTRPPDEGQQDG